MHSSSQRMRESASVFTPECMADRVPSGSLYSVADGRIAENVVSRRGNRPGQRALVRPDDRRPILRFASGVRQKREKKSERDKREAPPQKNLFLGDQMCTCMLPTHSLTQSRPLSLTGFFSFLFLFAAPFVPPFT
ncbi:hypothetical protein CI102_14685 [Trichoderma harzianum]|nr:hypothetical protein CI102_14685 [Trichoderma harzianum]